MIEKITNARCYSAFQSRKRPCCHSPHIHEEAPTKVKVGSLLGSGIGALGSVYLLAKGQSKALKKPVNIFNVKYSELGIQGIATAALAGGLGAGIALDEKQHTKAKVREGIHQAIANILFPLLLIGGANKAYDVISPQLKLPQINSSSKGAKLINGAVQVVPRLALTMAGLIGGVCLGTKVSNKINEECEHHCHTREVKPLDFIYHPDDVATALVLADKQGSIQKVVGKIIPPIFTLCGYQAGVKR